MFGQLADFESFLEWSYLLSPQSSSNDVQHTFIDEVR
jgi:hypothetical protein